MPTNSIAKGLIDAPALPAESADADDPLVRIQHRALRVAHSCQAPGLTLQQKYAKVVGKLEYLNIEVARLKQLAAI